MSKSKAKLFLIASMVIFATIGVFRRYIPLSSAAVATARAVIGMLFLVVLILVKGKKISLQGIKENLVPLGISGVMLGFNWILLFEAYNYTSVATATLCYYMAPVILIVVSPFVFKERLTAKRLVCVAVAVVGMVLVSGVLGDSGQYSDNPRGIAFGLAAAVLYATVVTCNKKLKGIGSLERTVIQLCISSIVLVFYTLMTEPIDTSLFTPTVLILLAVVGVIHTGIAYALYFGSIDKLDAQTVALYSYIDPVGAVLLSAVVLGEPLGIYGTVGAVLILAATLISETNRKK